MKILEARDGKLIVAELDLVERQLVGLFPRRAALALGSSLSCSVDCVCSSFLRRLSKVDVEILLAPLSRVSVWFERTLDVPAQLRHLLPQRFDQLARSDDPVRPEESSSPPRVDRGKQLLDRLLAPSTCFSAWTICLRALVVVEEGRVGRRSETAIQQA